MTPEDRFNFFWHAEPPPWSDFRKEFIRHITEAADQARRENYEACVKTLENAGYPNSADLIRASIAPPKPVWCEHISRHKHGQFMYSEYFPDSTMHGVPIHPSIDICPIAGCHAKRPEGV